MGVYTGLWDYVIIGSLFVIVVRVGIALRTNNVSLVGNAHCVPINLLVRNAHCAPITILLICDISAQYALRTINVRLLLRYYYYIIAYQKYIIGTLYA